MDRSTLFVDTRVGALCEAGDLLIPMASGVIWLDDIASELCELVSAVHPGITVDQEINMFKSVGNAVEDLASAVKCYESVVNSGN